MAGVQVRLERPGFCVYAHLTLFFYIFTCPTDPSR